MTRYRIIRKPSYLQPTQSVYDVEKRVLWWWENAGSSFLTFEAAKERISELQAAEANPIKRQVVYTEP